MKKPRKTKTTSQNLW